MSSKYRYAEDKVLDHALGTTSWTMPTSTHIRLYSVAPTNTTAGTELSGNGYAASSAVTWDASSAGATANAGVITFTATGAWSQILGHAVTDQSGNLIYWEAVTGPTLADGDSYEFAIGAFDITES